MMDLSSGSEVGGCIMQSVDEADTSKQQYSACSRLTGRGVSDMLASGTDSLSRRIGGLVSPSPNPRYVSLEGTRVGRGKVDRGKHKYLTMSSR